jgi:hypothetical protein
VVGGFLSVTAGDGFSPSLRAALAGVADAGGGRGLVAVADVAVAGFLSKTAADGLTTAP